MAALSSDREVRANFAELAQQWRDLARQHQDLGDPPPQSNTPTTCSQSIRQTPLQWEIVALVKALNVVGIEAFVTDLHPGAPRAHGRKFLDGEPNRLRCGRKATIAQRLSRPALALAHEQLGGCAVVECRSLAVGRHIPAYRCSSALAHQRSPGWGGHKQVWLPAFAGKPCAVAGGHELRRDSALSISFSNALMSASHMFGPQVRTFLLAVVKALYYACGKTLGVKEAERCHFSRSRLIQASVTRLADWPPPACPARSRCRS